MTETVETLGEALPKEMARVRQVLTIYIEIGPAGRIGAHLIEQSLQTADKAVIEGDIVGMVRAYKDLQGITG
jgi:hypothetical protein